MGSGTGGWQLMFTSSFLICRWLKQPMGQMDQDSHLWMWVLSIYAVWALPFLVLLYSSCTSEPCWQCSVLAKVLLIFQQASSSPRPSPDMTEQLTLSYVFLHTSVLTYVQDCHTENFFHCVPNRTVLYFLMPKLHRINVLSHYNFSVQCLFRKHLYLYPQTHYSRFNKTICEKHLEVFLTLFYIPDTAKC